jgi:hypothetical protein
VDPKLEWVDLEEAEAEAWELDGLVGGLSPAPATGELGGELDEDAFDANILAAYIQAH